MISTSRPCIPYRRQRGTALIVGLIFLLVLTLIGISTMSTARLEQKMVANTQFSEWAFRDAESGIEVTFTEADIFGTLDSDDDGQYDVTLHTYGTTTKTGTRYMGAGLVPFGGFSLDAGMAAHHYEVTATGQAASGAVAVLRQGFYKIGPGG